MTRPDLRALTPASLVALANRGLVKRAVKELDAGAAPVLDLSEEGALHGRFPDGSEAVLPADVGFDGARCSCGAIGTCRHRVGLVLAYQRRYPAGELVVTSPGEITDEELAAAFGNRALTAARRVHRAGYSARIRRPSADDPVAEVELPACTVRFLVPGELGYVHTEASDAKREQTIVLAVWAFRAADENMLEVPELRLDVGGTGTPTTSGLESTLELVDKLLLEGAADAGPVLVARLERLHAELEAAQLRWPAAAVAELAEQLGFHRTRSAHYRPRRFAELLTELHARHRAALSGASPRSRVLGTDEPGETPLRRVRLTSLGCRISGVPGERRAEIYFADAHTASVLVLQRTWTVADGEKRTGADLADERVNGTSLLALASSNVVSESAYRSASRLLRLASARVAQTTTTPIGDSWARLPDALLVRDYRAFAAEIAALPPHLIRPRVAAELVRVVHIAEVRQVTYHPGDQRLDAEIADAHGATATIRAHYSEYRPGALDALATALTSGAHYVSGALHQAHGTLVVDPIAVLTDPTPTDPTPTDHASTHPALPHARSTHPAPTHPAPSHSDPPHPAPVDSGPAHRAPTHSDPPRRAQTHRAPTHPAPIHSDLTHQGPVDSGPTHLAPTDSAPTHSDLIHQDSADSGPTHRAPTHPASAHRGPAHSGPPHPAPIHRGPAHSGPTHSAPTHAGATDSGPTRRGQNHPGPTGRRPTHHSPTDRGPTDRGSTDRGQPHSGLTNPALIHPDLTPSDAHVPLPTTPTTSPPDAITVALDLLATTAHHGLRHATSPTPAVAGDVLTQAVTALATAGYPAAASALAAFADSCNTGADLTRTWLAAYLRLSLTSPHR